MYRNAKNVGYVMIGSGAINQLGDILAPRRKEGTPAVWFFDHFFEHNDLTGRLPVESGDIVIYVDTTDEPTTDGVDAYTKDVKARLGGKLPAPCSPSAAVPPWIPANAWATS